MPDITIRDQVMHHIRQRAALTGRFDEGICIDAMCYIIPGLRDVMDGEATIIPNKIGKEDAEGIWEAAYDAWADFGASDAEAGQAAHGAIIAASPYRKDQGP